MDSVVEPKSESSEKIEEESDVEGLPKADLLAEKLMAELNRNRTDIEKEFTIECQFRVLLPNQKIARDLENRENHCMQRADEEEADR